jgi:hypothetical protein
MLWYDFVNNGLILSCIIVILLKYRLLPDGIRLFLLYFILTLILEVASDFFITKSKNNLFLYHFSTPIQYAILCYYFLLLFGQNKNKKILFVSAISVVIVLILSLFFNSISQYFSYASMMKNIIITILVLIYFRKIFISSVNYENPVEENVWICTGLFIYSLGNFFIEGSFNYLMEEAKDISHKLYYLHVALDFLFSIIFICAVAFKKNTRVR